MPLQHDSRPSDTSKNPQNIDTTTSHPQPPTILRLSPLLFGNRHAEVATASQAPARPGNRPSAPAGPTPASVPLSNLTVDQPQRPDVLPHPAASQATEQAQQLEWPFSPQSSLSDPASPIFPVPSSKRPPTANPRLTVPSLQPPYPSPLPAEVTQTRTSRSRWSLRNAFAPASLPPTTSLPQLPNLPTYRLQLEAQLEAQRTARLWNPSNSTPRTRRSTRAATARTRARSGASIPRPPVPLHHPQLTKGEIGGEIRSGGDIEFIGIKDQGGAGEYPLLSLREQRQSRNSSARASLQVEYSASSGTQSNRISLPRSIKSIDVRRSLVVEDPKRVGATDEERKDKGKGKQIDEAYTHISIDRRATGYRKRGQSLSGSHPPVTLPQNLHKETGRSITHPYKNSNMTDLERGPATLHPNRSNHSFNHGGLDGLAPALAPHADSFASSNTSIQGSLQAAPGEDDAWGPAHPCFPHLNPYVSVTSPLYESTRIIRVRRDWMVAGDLAPTFSVTYPELLGEAGLGEAEFRRTVEDVNARLVAAFNPFGARNLLDTVLGMCTGWLWDDTGLTHTKRSLAEVERLLEGCNQRLEKEGAQARFVPLKKSAYMSLDIQIPTPQIGFIEMDDGEEDGRTTSGGTDRGEAEGVDSNRNGDVR